MNRIPEQDPNVFAPQPVVPGNLILMAMSDKETVDKPISNFYSLS